MIYNNMKIRYICISVKDPITRGKENAKVRATQQGGDREIEVFANLGILKSPDGYQHMHRGVHITAYQ